MDISGCTEYNGIECAVDGRQTIETMSTTGLSGCCTHLRRIYISLIAVSPFSEFSFVLWLILHFDVFLLRCTSCTEPTATMQESDTNSLSALSLSALRCFSRIYERRVHSRCSVVATTTTATHRPSERILPDKLKVRHNGADNT